MHRTGRRMAASAIGLLAPLLGACTLRSLDYLTNGDASTPADGPGAGDTNSDVADAGNVDSADAVAGDGAPPAEGATVETGHDSGATSDAPLSDTSSMDHAVVDSGTPTPDAEAGPSGTWCQQQQPTARLCMDFDEGALTKAYIGGFSSLVPAPVVETGATATLGTPAKSAPQAFVANVSALGTGIQVHSQFQEPLVIPTSVTSLRMRFDLNIVTLSSAQEIDFALFYLPAPPDGGADYRTYLVFLGSQGRIITDRGGSTSFGLPIDGQFHNYRLDLSLSGGLTFSLYLDDPTASSSPAAQIVEPAPFGSSTQATFLIGASAYGVSNAFQLNYDNIVFDGQ